MRRPRGLKGRFLTAAEIAAMEADKEQNKDKQATDEVNPPSSEAGSNDHTILGISNSGDMHINHLPILDWDPNQFEKLKQLISQSNMNFNHEILIRDPVFRD